MQQQITDIWEDVLERKGIGASEDFFDLGGTSLGLIQVFARVNEKFDLSLNGSILEEETTIAHLASCVDAELQGA